MRSLVLTALLALGAIAVAEACSLAIPFDEYPGPPLDGSSPPPGPPDDSDGGPGPSDAADADPCDFVDVRGDPNNCVVCGRRCANGGTCDNGRCPVELVTEAGAIVSLTLAPAGGSSSDAGEYLYISAGGQLGRWRVEDGPPTMRSLDVAPGNGATVSGTAVLTTNNGGAGLVITEAGLSSFRRDTFATTGLSAWVAGPVFALAVADTTTAFWSDADGLSWNEITRGNGNNQRNRWDGGVPPRAFAVANGIVYWTTDHEIFRTAASTPGSPAVFVSYPPGVLQSLSAGGGVQVGRQSQGVQYLEIDPTQHGKEIRTVALFSDTIAMAANGGFVYVLNRFEGRRARLYRTTANGTQSVVLVNDIPNAAATLAVDSTFVYYSDGTSVLRTTK